MRWRARTIVQLHRAVRACRPQLKRDPLGRAVIPGSIVVVTDERRGSLTDVGGAPSAIRPACGATYAHAA